MTPRPFEFEWTAKIGPITESGRGVLLPHVFKERHNIDEFHVRLPGWTLGVFPKQGEIRFDQTRTVSKLKEGHGALIWFRRMEKEIGTHDKNSAPPRCLWYGVGIWVGDDRIGFRLFENGRYEEGGI